MIRYFGDYVVDSLESQRLKVSRPSLLNDPFEFSITPKGSANRTVARQHIRSRLKTGEFQKAFRQEFKREATSKEIKQFVRRNQKYLQNNFLSGDYFAEFDKIKHEVIDSVWRLLCFSERTITEHGDILMWSHYGNAHKGFRLHFNDKIVDGMKATKVSIKYRKERPNVDLNILPDDPRYDAQLIDGLTSKAVFWSYEKEIRYLIHPRFCTSEGTMDFAPLNPSGLDRIDFGIQASDTIKKRITSIVEGEAFNHVELYQASLHKKDFSIEYVKI